MAVSVTVLPLATSANAQVHPGAKPPANLQDCAPLKGQTLRCPSLGFAYEVPFGWVDRTGYMQADAQQPGVSTGSQEGKADQKPSPAGGRTLLAVFQRPPGAPGEGVNSAVIIAAESEVDYPGVKSAADYFGPLAEIAEKHGLKMDGDPYSFSVGPKPLVRGDFSAGGGTKSVHQTSLVMLEKRYIVSFTFLSDSEDEIENLISNLSFGRMTRAAPSPHK